MTFFYDLNKKLAGINDKPSQTHGQLNERDMGKHNNKSTGFDALAKKAAKEYGSKEAGEGLAGAQFQKMKKAGKLEEQDMEEGLGDVVKKVGGMAKKLGSKALNTLGHGDDADMIRDLQRKMGVPQTGLKPGAEPNPKVVKEKMSPAKAQSFAALAPPKDKITFADKIAGAKKEVDEMLGDVAANAIKGALGGKTHKGGEVSKTKTGIKHKAAPGTYGGSEPDSDPLDKLKGPGKSRIRKTRPEAEMDEGWEEMMKSVRDRAEKPKVGSIERGALHDIEHTATGRKVTRRVDQNTGYSVGSDDDKPADGEKRGRGRPKGAPKAPERVTANATKHKGGRKMTKEEIDEAIAALEECGYSVSPLEEKAVSKKQQKFMGMVHATQKGEKAPSKEVAKVAKTMKKKDAEDFASTKHKGLPEKKKPEGKKKEKTEEAGGSGTPTASSGFSYGKGIYDSMNRDLENMIKESMARLDESMSVNMSSDSEGQHSLTVTAQEEDAVKLADILKSAGLGGGSEEGYGGGGYKSACGCGTPDCSCGDEEIDEVSMNEPDYPTNQEEGDALEYSGGLNGPKSTGQSTVPVLASQEERQLTAEEEEAELSRMIEMAGIQEAKKVEEDDVEEGNKFTGNLAKARAAGKSEADLDGDGDMEKVDESILASTRDLWKKYQG